MQNLDQIRAKNALEYLKEHKIDDSKVKKVPAMIMDNGILAAAAFAVDSNERDYEQVFNAIINHLRIRNLLAGETHQNLIGFIGYLSSEDSATLRNITDEALAYLNYLRRFA